MFAWITPLIILCISSSAALAEPPPCTEEIQRGIASWYGPRFEGKLTKSEEAFDPAALSAAHQTLPFGTLVKVTNMRNYKSVIVKVNDRGGFGKARVIDLSEAAAGQIGMIDEGIAPVAIFRCHP